MADSLRWSFDWVDLLPVLWLGIACWNIRRVPKREVVKEPLERQQGVSWRGLFACVVVLFHLSMEFSQTGRLLPFFLYWGELGNAVFFGLSGYGLMTQLSARQDYLAVFWRRRFPPLLWPYLLFGVLCAMQIWRGDILMGDRLAQQLGIVDNGWFCVVLAVFYVTFWVVFRFFPTQGGGAVALLSTLAFAETALFAGMSTNLYVAPSSGAFIVGLVLGRWPRETMDTFRRFPWFFWLLTVLILATHLFYKPFVFVRKTFFLDFTFNALFPVVLAAFGMKWRLGNRILAWLGTISYELYLAHGWVILEIRHWWPHMPDSAFVFATVAGSLLVASITHATLAPVMRRRG